MNPIVEVPSARLDSGCFGEPPGDIYAAYSADQFSAGKVKVFQYDGKLWTSGGGMYAFSRNHAHCYTLIPLEEYHGPLERVPYSCEGTLVKFKGRQYRLGPRVDFKGADRSVDEHRAHLRRKYEHGGVFTSGKTYHELLHDLAEERRWNSAKLEFELPTGNVVEAIRLELAQPDWTKHSAPKPAEEVDQPQMEMSLL